MPVSKTTASLHGRPMTVNAPRAGDVNTHRGAVALDRVAWIDRTIAFVVLLLMSKAILMLALTQGDLSAIDLADGSPLYQVLVALAYAVCALRVARRRQAALDLARQNPLLIALVLLAVVSVAWSVNPMVTLRRTIGLVGTTISAFYIATHFTPREFLRLLYALLASIAVLSLLAVLAVPGLAIHSDLHAGDWRGVFTHKNNLGEAMALGLTVSLLVRPRGQSRAVAMASAALCAGLLVMSASRASWAAALIAVLVAMITRFNRLPFWLRVPTLLVAVSSVATAGTLLWLNLDAALALVGRDLTLTGRTLLWAAAITAGLDRPILGYGYRAFWLGSSGGVASLGTGATAFAMEINHGHNGFLDLWLELGIPGLILFIAILFPFARRAFTLAKRGDVSEQWWPLILLVLLLPVSFATTVILDRNNYYWVIFVVTLLYLRSGAFARPDRLADAA